MLQLRMGQANASLHTQRCGCVCVLSEREWCGGNASATRLFVFQVEHRRIYYLLAF